jgi:FlaA1/EpsC-like NDP-sugar epimerase
MTWSPYRLLNRLAILPRWIIIILDIIIICISTCLGYLLRFNFNIREIVEFDPQTGILVAMLSGLVASLVTKSYAGIVRYTGVEDGIRIMYTTLLMSVLVAIVNLIYYYNFSRNLVPYSVLLITFFASFLFLFYYRLIVKSVFSFYKTPTSAKANALIYGAGHSGMMVRQVIDSDPRSKLRVVAFIEDDRNKIGKEIQGTKIFDADTEFVKLIEEYKIKELIIAIRDLSFDRKNEIVDQCLNHQIKIRSVPPVQKWVRGELSLRQIKEINIEDLLGRESITMGDETVVQELYQKIICITGAAGSIGSELARQVIMYEPSVVILIDQAETPLYQIEHELKLKGVSIPIKIFVADICNRDRISYIFRECKPDLILHAAAYKHVPMMESNPSEAAMCNVIGTKLLADLAVENKVSRFVMISTDKAVNPTSVMGCSKRIAEIYVQSLNNHLQKSGAQHTLFVTTRFGNVLGSNGSVIPLFRSQISDGGPVTVTHPEITRYFMTIPEACRLVLEAGAMGRGGEIFIFDMGKPIRIYDLARKMILLSGLTIGKDIEIVFTGLREGEKLYEELLNDKENTLPTHHEKILKAKVSEYPFRDIDNFVGLLGELIHDRNELKMVALMKEMVPEFKSNYSRFEILDRATPD